MQTFDVDGISFQFDDDWQVSKYDEWAFYKNQFSKIKSGIKSVDLIAISPSPDPVLWLIEAKDYRTHSRTKHIPIQDEFVQKVFDTLSALIPAKIRADQAEEKEIAKLATRAKKICLVLHLEQPTTHSKLRPRAINPADIYQKLRQSLKAIDPHPRVAESTNMQNLPWQVS